MRTYILAFSLIFSLPAWSQVSLNQSNMIDTPSHFRSDSNVTSELSDLKNNLFAQVPNTFSFASKDQQLWFNSVREQLSKANINIDHPMVLLAVDRNPKVQMIAVIFVSNDQPWEILGGIHVSTGKPGRKEHFKTPVGVFPNSADRLGYRAEGTYNQNHIRGLGVKGMRVWDFGWQQTENWRKPGSMSEIRMEMHSTDPANLEHRIGKPDSEGCIRIPATFNKFLDHYGIIDADYEQQATTDRRFDSLLPKNREPTALASDLLVVFDSGE